MSTLSKRAVAQLIDSIRTSNVDSHAYAARGGGRSSQMPYFLGSLEAVLMQFLTKQGFPEAAAQLPRAMREVPTETEIATVRTFVRAG